MSVEAIEDELGLTTAEATRVARFLPEAGAYLVSLKGAAWYTAWSSQGPVARPRPVNPDDVILMVGVPGGRINAERAEALLALYFALPQLNLALAPGGGVLAVTYTSTASGTVQTRFASSDMLDGLRRELLTHAKLLIDGDVRIVYASYGQVFPDGAASIDSVSSLGAGSSLDAI